MMGIMARVLVLVLACSPGARWCRTSERARNPLRSTGEKDDERECQDPSTHFFEYMAQMLRNIPEAFARARPVADEAK